MSLLWPWGSYLSFIAHLIPKSCNQHIALSFSPFPHPRRASHRQGSWVGFFLKIATSPTFPIRFFWNQVHLSPGSVPKLFFFLEFWNFDFLIFLMTFHQIFVEIATSPTFFWWILLKLGTLISWVSPQTLFFSEFRNLDFLIFFYEFSSNCHWNCYFYIFQWKSVRPWSAISQKCMGQLVWIFAPRRSNNLLISFKMAAWRWWPSWV